MKPIARCLTLIALLIFLQGCATSTCCGKKPKITFGAITNDQICAAIHANALPEGENFKITVLSEQPDRGFYLVQIRDKERLHKHNTHSAKVVLWKGKGTLQLGGEKRLLMEGAEVDIPAGVPHAFTNEWDKPSIAVVQFTPPFDGKDTEYLE